jgi:hypothetical protein
MARFADTTAQTRAVGGKQDKRKSTNRRRSETCDPRRGLLAGTHRRPARLTTTELASAVMAPLARSLETLTVSVVGI